MEEKYLKILKDVNKEINNNIDEIVKILTDKTIPDARPKKELIDKNISNINLGLDNITNLINYILEN